MTAAAASWAPVDFDTADLPTTLSPLIQQASAADGVSHVLPDAATAQAHLRTAFFCTHSGYYEGRFSGGFEPAANTVTSRRLSCPMAACDPPPWGGRSPDGFRCPDERRIESRRSTPLSRRAPQAPAWTCKVLSLMQTILSGTYLAAEAGSFEALGDASVAATYKFTGDLHIDTNYPSFSGPYSAPVFFGTDDGTMSQASSSASTFGGLTLNSLAGTVSGNAFTGTASYIYPGNGRGRLFYAPVSGTYLNTTSGATFDGQFSISNM